MTTPAGNPRADDSPAKRAGSVDEVLVDLPSDARAPGQARLAVRTTLQDWRLPDLLDAITLVVSELVTNAVRHGLPPVRMVLARRPRDVRVTVYDDAATEPGQPRLPDDDAEGGRGLAIIEALSDQTGVETIPGDGKAVYARFNAPAA